MPLVIGSVALSKYTNLGRKPRDLDVIIDPRTLAAYSFPVGSARLRHLAANHYAADDVWGYKHVEFEVALPGTSADLYLSHYENTPKADRIFLNLPEIGPQVWVAGTDILYSIKRSHRHFPRHWDKHIMDYHLLKGFTGGVDTLETITKLRTDKETATLRTPSLNKTTEAFFDDNVSNRYFVHDHIHNVMAHYDRPLFERIKIDTTKVACSKTKFLELSEEDRNKCVLEEAYVIALERGIIPMLYGGKNYVSAEGAIRWALMRICTTLCSGWFRDYATENYPTILESYDKAYVSKFLNAVDEGRILQVKKA